MMDRIVTILAVLTLFLARDVGSESANSTPTTQLPTEDYIDSRTSSLKDVASKNINDSRIETSTQEQTTVLRRSVNVPSARNAGPAHLGWPTIPGRTNVNISKPIAAFLVRPNPSEGDRVTLSCIVYDPNILTVSWYRGERLSTHDMLAPSADIQRMSILHDIADDSRRVFNLTIEFLHSNDSGTYTCRGINRPNSGVSIDLTVRYVPELHYPECYLNGKRQARVTEGDNLRFECRSEKGIPPWTLIWFKQQNQSIAVISTSIQDRSELIMSEHSIVASSDLSGSMFMCSLVCLSPECLKSHNNGPRNCNIGPLIVQPRPPEVSPPIITIDPGIQIASEGDDVQFSCSTSLADGNAVWFPVGEEAPMDDHIIVSNDGSQMSIMNVKENDTELMACGVFCQDKLISVGQVNLQVLRKEDTTTVRATTTPVSTTIPSTEPSSHSTDGSSNRSIGSEKRRREEREEKPVLFGAPLAIIFILLLLIFLLFFVARFKRHAYQPVSIVSSTKELPDLPLPV